MTAQTSPAVWLAVLVVVLMFLALAALGWAGLKMYRKLRK